jgi:hypothetical protein
LCLKNVLIFLSIKTREFCDLKILVTCMLIIFEEVAGKKFFLFQSKGVREKEQQQKSAFGSKQIPRKTCDGKKIMKINIIKMCEFFFCYSMFSRIFLIIFSCSFEPVGSFLSRLLNVSENFL